MSEQESTSASNNSDFEKRMVELTRQAGLASSRGNKQDAIELIEQIIRLGEDNSVPTFNFKLLREALLAKGTYDKSTFVPIMKDALAFYKQRKDSVNQINTIISLIHLLYDLGEIEEASQYLAEAKVLVSSLTPRDISAKHLSNRSSYRADFIDKSLKIIELQSRLQRASELLKGN